MATQNPIESLGTYKLPEAQIDRFMFKLQMKYPSPEEELLIMHQNSTLKRFEEFNVNTVFTTEQILLAQQDVKKIYMDKRVERYIVGLVEATRNPEKYNVTTGKYIDYGTSPRSTIALFIASKAYALLNGKSFVTPMHVKSIAHNVLRHRILFNYEGQADEISTDKIIDEILRKVPVP